MRATLATLALAALAQRYVHPIFCHNACRLYRIGLAFRLLHPATATRWNQALLDWTSSQDGHITRYSAYLYRSSKHQTKGASCSAVSNTQHISRYITQCHCRKQIYANSSNVKVPLESQNLEEHCPRRNGKCPGQILPFHPSTVRMTTEPSELKKRRRITTSLSRLCGTRSCQHITNGHGSADWACSLMTTLLLELLHPLWNICGSKLGPGNSDHALSFGSCS